MPIYKRVELPNGRIVQRRPGESSNGGRVLDWVIPKTKGSSPTYQAALGRLAAIKIRQGKTPKKRKHRTVKVRTNKKREIDVKRHPREYKPGKFTTVRKHRRNITLYQDKRLETYHEALRNYPVVGKDSLTPEQMREMEERLQWLEYLQVHGTEVLGKRPLARAEGLREFEIRRTSDPGTILEAMLREKAFVRDEFDLTEEELRKYFFLHSRSINPVLPPRAVPGTLDPDEMKKLGWTVTTDFGERLIPAASVFAIKGVDREIGDMLYETRLEDGRPIRTIADYMKWLEELTLKHADKKGESLADSDIWTIEEYQSIPVEQRQRAIMQSLSTLNKSDKERVYAEMVAFNFDPGSPFLGTDEAVERFLTVIENAVAEILSEKVKEKKLKPKGPGGRPTLLESLPDAEINRRISKLLTSRTRDRADTRKKIRKLELELQRRKETRWLDSQHSLVDSIEQKTDKTVSAKNRLLISTGIIPVTKEIVNFRTPRTIRDKIKSHTRSLEDGSLRVGRILYQPIPKRPIEPEDIHKVPVISRLLFTAGYNTLAQLDKVPPKTKGGEQFDPFKSIYFMKKPPKAKTIFRLPRVGLMNVDKNTKEASFSNVERRILRDPQTRRWRTVEIGGNMRFDRKDIMKVLAAIGEREPGESTFPLAEQWGLSKEEKRKPYTIWAAFGQPLVFITKDSYYAVEPTEIEFAQPTGSKTFTYPEYLSRQAAILQMKVEEEKVQEKEKLKERREVKTTRAKEIEKQLKVVSG